MRAFDLSKVVTVDALVRAIPDHPSPLSAVMALVDAGVLAMDTRSAFEATTRLWRVAPGVSGTA